MGSAVTQICRFSGLLAHCKLWYAVSASGVATACMGGKPNKGAAKVKSDQNIVRVAGAKTVVFKIWRVHDDLYTLLNHPKAPWIAAVDTALNINLMLI